MFRNYDVSMFMCVTYQFVRRRTYPLSDDTWCFQISSSNPSMMKSNFPISSPSFCIIREFASQSFSSNDSSVPVISTCVSFAVDLIFCTLDTPLIDISGGVRQETGQDLSREVSFSASCKSSQQCFLLYQIPHVLRGVSTVAQMPRWFEYNRGDH